MAPRWRLGLRLLATCSALALGLWQLPHRICAVDADGWQERNAELGGQLAQGTTQLLDAARDPDSFHTGSRRFDGEWLYGSTMMTAMGRGQLAVSDPSRASHHLADMDRALTRLLEDEQLRAFDTEAWHRDALEALGGTDGHVAYLGYTNLALSLRRRVGGAGPHDAMNDAISQALRRRFDESPSALLHTYPGEIYPVDNAAAVASIALHARATGAPLPAIVARFVEQMHAHWLDAHGLLHQRMEQNGRTPADAARGSGTALAAYFLSFADLRASRSLYEAVRRELTETVLGFGAVREYPSGASGQFHGADGDIDSGPLIAGYSISASGFSLAGARIHRDRATFERLYATAHLFGAPYGGGESRQFVSGGTIGNAILLAMLTALPGGAA